MKLILYPLLLSAALLMQAAIGQSTAPPQVRAQDGESRPAGENAIGKVTAISTNAITIIARNGGSITIKLSDQTRILQGPEPAKLSDIHVDDTIFARGTLSGAVMDAALVSKVDPAMMQRMQQGGMGMNSEDLGKKFIVGEVKAINALKLTIAMPNQKTQTIEVDETTSFKKAGASITLADISVGDFVHGRGEVKGGVFVPAELIVGPPPGQGMMNGGGRRMRSSPPDPQNPNQPESNKSDKQPQSDNQPK